MADFIEFFWDCSTALDSNQKVALVCSARSGSTKATGTTNLLLRAASEALQASTPNSDPVHGVANDRFTSPPRTPTPGGHSNGAFQPPQQHRPARTASSAVLNGWQSNPTSRASSPAPNLGMTSSISSLRSEKSFSSPPPLPAFHATVDEIKAEHMAAAKQYIQHPEVLAKLEDDIDHDCEKLRSFLVAAQIIEEISLRSKDVIMGVGERLSCRIVAAVLKDRVCKTLLANGLIRY